MKTTTIDITTFRLPYGIIAKLHPTGAVVTCDASEWVRTAMQARGLRMVLRTVADSLECGIEPDVLIKPVRAMIEALKENRIGMA